MDTVRNRFVLLAMGWCVLTTTVVERLLYVQPAGRGRETRRCCITTAKREWLIQVDPD